MRPKDPLPVAERSGVIYRINCNNCPSNYVGETSKRVSTRMQEHKLAIRRGEQHSQLLAHMMENGHAFDFNGVRVMASDPSKSGRLLKEAWFSDGASVNRHVELCPAYQAMRKWGTCTHPQKRYPEGGADHRIAKMYDLKECRPQTRTPSSISLHQYAQRVEGTDDANRALMGTLEQSQLYSMKGHLSPAPSSGLRVRPPSPEDDTGTSRYDWIHPRTSSQEYAGMESPPRGATKDSLLQDAQRLGIWGNTPPVNSLDHQGTENDRMSARQLKPEVDYADRADSDCPSSPSLPTTGYSALDGRTGETNNDGASMASMGYHRGRRLESPRMTNHDEWKIGHAHRVAARGNEDRGSGCPNEAAELTALKLGGGEDEDEEKKGRGKGRSQAAVMATTRRTPLTVTNPAAGAERAPVVKRGEEDVISKGYEERTAPRPVNGRGRYYLRDGNGEPQEGPREKHPRKCKAPTPPNNTRGIPRLQQRKGNRREGVTNNDGASNGEMTQPKRQGGIPGGDQAPGGELRERYPRRCKKQVGSAEDTLGARLVRPPYGVGTEGRKERGDNRLSGRKIKKTGSEVEVSWVGPLTRSRRNNQT